MNIGIVVYSQTGNTESVVRKLQEKLSAGGNTVEIVHLKAVGDVRPRMENVELESVPGVAGYDAVVFASPVQAFTLSSVMNAYLTQLDSLKNQKVALLVTEFFPFPFMGGNQAIGKMRQICEGKGARICCTEVINWSRRSRERMIADCVFRMGASLAAKNERNVK